MDSTLHHQHCVPCEGGIAPLSKADADEAMKHIPGWVLRADGKEISREFLFKDFKEAMEFVNKVADLAEQEGHHPDIHVFWNKVRLDLSTHSIGGLSTNDFIVATHINTIAR
jgi:4a-hydroxytetrahydrobiopterin dehydratase